MKKPRLWCAVQAALLAYCVADLPARADAPPDPDLLQRVDSYEQRFLSIDRRIIRQGQERRLIDLSRFYEMVGRPELATQYRKDIVAGNVTAVIGLFALIGGGVAAGANRSGDCVSDGMGGCREWDHTTANIGAGVAVAGIGLCLLGLSMTLPPTSYAQDQAMADDYNRKLRAELHLPPLAAPRVGILPYVAPDGGGMRVGGTF
jgi:hypothetical protein